MRLRKELDEMQEKDILLIARISDALAHPARRTASFAISMPTVREFFSADKVFPFPHPVSRMTASFGRGGSATAPAQRAPRLL